MRIVPNSVSWATSDIGHEEVGRSRANGNAIIARANDRASDADMSRVPDVDAIGVRAIFWR